MPFPRSRYFDFGFVLAIVGGIVFGLYSAVMHVRESAARVNCNLGQLGLAFHVYADNHGGRLPPAAVCDESGNPLLSWRVLLLPYIEQQPLFDEFRLNEPWDSPHNIKLLDRMPRTYKSPFDRYVEVPPTHSVLKVFVGPGAAFERARGLSLKDDFPDGTGDTWLYVEACDPVPWTKPEDVDFDPNREVKLSGVFKKGMYRSGTVDGSGYKNVLPDEVDWTRMRGAITRNGGEAGPRPWER